MLFRELGAQYRDEGSLAAGADVVRDTLDDFGVRPKIVDGSGLSRSNRATPRQVVRLLERMHNQDIAQTFRDSLAVTGRDRHRQGAHAPHRGRGALRRRRPARCGSSAPWRATAARRTGATSASRSCSTRRTPRRRRRARTGSRWRSPGWRPPESTGGGRWRVPQRWRAPDWRRVPSNGPGLFGPGWDPFRPEVPQDVLDRAAPLLGRRGGRLFAAGCGDRRRRSVGRRRRAESHDLCDQRDGRRQVEEGDDVAGSGQGRPRDDDAHQLQHGSALGRDRAARRQPPWTRS